MKSGHSRARSVMTLVMFLYASTLLVSPVVSATRRSSASLATLTGDLIGQIGVSGLPSGTKWAGEGDLYFFNRGLFDGLDSKYDSDQDPDYYFGGSHSGRLEVNVYRNGGAGFSFHFHTDVDGDGNLDGVALHNVGGSVGDVVRYGRDRTVVDFVDDRCELWIAYLDAEGRIIRGEAWFPIVTITIDITRA